jgi:hypothetical protein
MLLGGQTRDDVEEGRGPAPQQGRQVFIGRGDRHAVLGEEVLREVAPVPGEQHHGPAECARRGMNPVGGVKARNLANPVAIARRVDPGCRKEATHRRRHRTGRVRRALALSHDHPLPLVE